MATTTNYSWTTPDDTDLVKDGAAAIRTLGSSVDTTTKALNPSTTLGDIEYRSSTANTNTRLGIGSTGDVLTVAGGVPSWAAPAGGGANFTLLNAGGTALTGATSITVSGISGQNQLLIAFDSASSANASSYISLQFNADAGNHNYYSNFIDAATAYNANIFRGLSNLSQTDVIIGRMGATAGQNVSGQMMAHGCNSSGAKTFQYSGGGSNGNVNMEIHWGGGYYTGSSTISSIKIISSTGNFDNGTIYIYGSA
jgi:hypothetical protein